MSFSNVMIEQLIKDKNKELEETINLMEVNLTDNEDFDRGMALFHFGRLQAQYLEMQSLMRNQHILDEQK